jgi:hypothetical protein
MLDLLFTFLEIKFPEQVSSPANNRKNGEYIFFDGFNIKFGMPGIYHQHTNFLAIDIKRIDYITNCCLVVYLSLLNLKAIIPKVGEEFNCYIHVKYFLIRINANVFSTLRVGGSLRTDVLVQ